MQDGDNNYQNEMSILKRLGWFGVGMAGIWAIAMIVVAVVLTDGAGLKDVSPVNCEEQYQDAFERLHCIVEELRQNQLIQQAKVDNLGFSIEYNGIILGTIAAFFGALITVIVIFFTLKSTREAKLEARDTADRLMDEKEVELNNRISEAQERIAELELRISQINELHRDAVEKKKGIDEVHADLMNRNIDGEANVEPEDSKKVAETAKNKDASIRSRSEWLALAFDLVEKEQFIEAADAFQGSIDKTTKEADRAKLLFNVGLSYHNANSIENARKIYQELIEKGRNSTNLEILEQVSKAWVNLATLYTSEANDNPEPQVEVEICKAVIEWGKDRTHPFILVQVAKAWHNLAIVYTEDIDGWKKSPKKRIKTFQELIAWGKDTEIPELKELIAKSWVALALTYAKKIDGWEKQPDQEIACYKEFINWGKASRLAGVQEAVSIAWYNWGMTYTDEENSGLQNPKLTFSTMHDLIEWGRDIDLPEVREHVAKAKMVIRQLA